MPRRVAPDCTSGRGTSGAATFTFVTVVQRCLLLTGATRASTACTISSTASPKPQPSSCARTWLRPCRVLTSARTSPRSTARRFSSRKLSSVRPHAARGKLGNRCDRSGGSARRAARRGPAERGPLDPCAAAPDARGAAVAVTSAAHGVEIGIGAARQLRVIVVPTPLPHASVHVVDVPGIRGVAADLLGMAVRSNPAVIRLYADGSQLLAQRIAEGGHRAGAGAAGVLPLHLGRERERPVRRQRARAVSRLGQTRTERLGFGELIQYTGTLSPSPNSADGNRSGKVPITRFQ